MSRRHFLVSKGLAEDLFREGQQFYEQERYSGAAKSWGQAALLQHGASHAFLSDMLIYGRPAVVQDEKRAFELAAAGAAMGCAHSKGALGRCFVSGSGVAKDVAKGLALGRESAAAGSSFGQFVVGWCYDEGWGVAQDDAEAVRWYRLAAEQGHSSAQYNLGCMFSRGGRGFDYFEAVRLWRLAAAQGDAHAQCNFGIIYETGQGVYRLAGVQGRTFATAALALLGA
jgi:TPR repeat protein